MYFRQLGAGEHPQHIIENARAVSEKHPDDTSATFFASIGGPDLSHAERDFHRRCGNLYGYDLEPWYITVRIKEPETETETDFKLACLAPHEIFGSLHLAGQQFKTSCIGTTRVTRSLFGHIGDLDGPGRPWAAGKPRLADPPEIVDFGGLGGPGRPGNHSNRFPGRPRETLLRIPQVRKAVVESTQSSSIGRALQV